MIDNSKNLSLAEDNARSAYGHAKYRYRRDPESLVAQKEISDTYKAWIDAQNDSDANYRLKKSCEQCG